jgi:hypothetical protein
MPSDPAKSASERNLLLVVAALVVAAGMVAVLTAWICGYVLDSLHNSNAMALLLTDAGVKADDANLERQLSVATAALVACRDLAFALGIGCLGVGVAGVGRVMRS